MRMNAKVIANIIAGLVVVAIILFGVSFIRNRDGGPLLGSRGVSDAVVAQPQQPTVAPTEPVAPTPTEKTAPVVRLPTVTPTSPAAFVVNVPAAVATPTPVVLHGVVNTQSLNIRSGPGTEYAIFDTASQGACASIVAFADGWAQLDLDDAGQGWSSAEFFDLVDACPDATPAP